MKFYKIWFFAEKIFMLVMYFWGIKLLFGGDSDFKNGLLFIIVSHIMALSSNYAVVNFYKIIRNQKEIFNKKNEGEDE